MFTHPFQALLIVATMAAATAVPLLVGLPMMPRYGVWPLVVATGAACVIVVVALPLWIIPLSNWLYLAAFRRTVVTFEEAREFSPLFMPNRAGSWFPVPELTEMPREARVPYLRAVLERAREDGVIRQPWGRRRDASQAA